MIAFPKHVKHKAYGIVSYRKNSLTSHAYEEQQRELCDAEEFELRHKRFCPPSEPRKVAPNEPWPERPAIDFIRRYDENPRSFDLVWVLLKPNYETYTDFRRLGIKHRCTLSSDIDLWIPKRSVKIIDYCDGGESTEIRDRQPIIRIQVTATCARRLAQKHHWLEIKEVNK